MTADDVERVAQEIWNSRYAKDGGVWAYVETKDVWYAMARAALSAMPQRVSPELIAKLNALASRLTQMGKYEAVDLIDTVVARVTAMPQRELLAEALDALDALIPEAINDRYVTQSPAVESARAAADKIRDALTQEKQT